MVYRKPIFARIPFSPTIGKKTEFTRFSASGKTR